MEKSQQLLGHKKESRLLVLVLILAWLICFSAWLGRGFTFMCVGWDTHLLCVIFLFMFCFNLLRIWVVSFQLPVGCGRKINGCEGA